MSFGASISHEGYAFFQVLETIDFDRLERDCVSELAALEVVARLRSLLQSKLPITDPELLMRIRNSKKFHPSKAAANSATAGMAGLTFGLSDTLFNKSLPLFKEKHLPQIRELVIGPVVACGLNEKTLAVLEAHKGARHVDGRPDLVPSYQFLVSLHNTVHDFC